MKKILAGVTAASTMLVANASLAQTVCTDPASGKPVLCPPVPEISALEGTAALAALAAIVLLAWERRRRAA
ncbi:hypothetical protein [Poseidonocella sedimentorum]|uniref:hypothetical protein n=1 Tax=Poseidonocella sedimentorum TaxID=871652 RepID=UPI00116060D4|nr:hypothetical protein [Poseidonocella sedimentorum]